MDLFQKVRTINILSPDVEQQKGLFLKRVGRLLEEGYSIKNALIFLGKFKKKNTKSWITAIQEGLLTGSSFQEELGKIGFSNKICSQIYFAAQYGNYAETITRCGEQLLEGQKTQKKLRSLLTYPVVLLLFLLSMLMIMRFLILPNMAMLLSSSTDGVDIYSNVLVSLIYYSPQLLIGFALVLSLVFFLLKNKLGKKTPIEQIEYFMKWPLLDRYLKDYWTHFFFFEWGHLFKNGSSFQEIINIMRGAEASLLLQEMSGILTQEMSLGKSMKEALEAFPFFHDEGMSVITHGENLGQLSTEMLIYASHCEMELINRIEKSLEKIQPIIFSFIAVMIVAIYASMMLPIFSLMEGM